eukprot:TRINITY_DN9407_c0_g3_i6.p1 TRINITY_DN9407_c0_g3~~TRINITY_DN9407_c0_g3_i6.p1  ORF type:complete len:128 (-),score=35.89 TRINITY_DN9407_c0_g3_i6:39-422(-)
MANKEFVKTDRSFNKLAGLKRSGRKSSVSDYNSNNDKVIFFASANGGRGLLLHGRSNSYYIPSNIGEANEQKFKVNCYRKIREKLVSYKQSVQINRRNSKDTSERRLMGIVGKKTLGQVRSTTSYGL